MLQRFVGLAQLSREELTGAGAGADTGGSGPSGGWLHEKGANDTGDILWTIQEKKTEKLIDKHLKVSFRPGGKPGANGWFM